MNHFAVYGLPLSVDVDVKALEAEHRRRSLEVHPDRLGAADAKTRLKAAETSAALNDAVRVLRDPVTRAFHLLALKGVALDTEQAAAKLKMPMAFLEEVMERREALDAATSAQDRPAIESMAREVRQLHRAALEKANVALRADDVPTASVELGRVRYYSRFLEEVDTFDEENES